MCRKSKIRCGGLIFRTLAGFIFIAFSIALPAMSVDFSQEPVRLGSGWVSAIAFSPDGTILAAWYDADGDWQTVEGELRLLDVQTQQQVGTLKEDLGTINSIAFSPDGTLMALGGADNTIRLWDVAGLNQVGLMQSPTTWGVYSLTFSPDGKILVSSGWGNNTVRLWDVQTQRQIGVLRGHSKSVLSVAFSPDGRLLASGGHRGDEAIRLWDIQTQQQVGELTGHLDITYDLAFSPDGTILASAGGWYDKAVYLWDFQIQNQVGMLGGHSGHVLNIAFSPDGKLLASIVAGDDTVHLWNVEGQEQVGVLRGHNASDGSSDEVAFSPDGKWLACGVGNGVELWEFKPDVDFNDDGIVDSLDVCIMIDHWGTDEPLCDIGPMPWGDGIVDVEDLIVLAGYLFEEFPPAEVVE